MARNTRKGRAANGARPQEEAVPESLDQVRDILFGGQMRMVDARLKHLEERVREEQAALRTELARQLAELDETTRKGFASQAEKLAAKRIEELKALAGEFREAFKGLERRHLKLEELTGLADAELRDQLVKHSEAMSAEIARVSDRFATDLDRRASALQDQKLDTAAFAAALTDVAGRLTGGGRSGKGNAKG